MRKPLIHQNTKRDFLFCLGIWLALEVLCFLIFPLLGVISFEDTLGQWLPQSVVLGLLGASLFAVSTELFMMPLPSLKATTKKAQVRLWRFGRSLIGGLAAWAGLIGVAFPIVIVSTRVFTAILQNL